MQFARIILLSLLVLSSRALAQDELLRDRWQTLSSPHFVFFSQLSASRTERLAQELELWRQISASVITGGGTLPAAAIKTHVYVFDKPASFAPFAQADETGFFIPTPRRNFLALIYADELSLTQARHHYVHFLLRNFVDLRIPRWYEEGLAGYLDSLQVERDQVALPRYSERDFRGSLQVSREVSLQELLYDEAALASPRLIQIANLKSESLLYFLWHGWEEGFVDRRPQLQNYLQLSLAGRSQRFAFDQSFNISASDLDDEYERFLRESDRRGGTLDTSHLQPVAELRADVLSSALLATALGELSLNSGHFAAAEEFFRSAVDYGAAPARSLAGIADALRMQEPEDGEIELRELYRQALAQDGDNPETLLDLGEYWESVISDCDRNLTAAEISSIKLDMQAYFSRALAANPENAEANLAMAQYYLLAGESVVSGIGNQRKAMALLPADTFVMEQAVRYAIEEQRYDEARRLIVELSQPLHLWGEPDWVGELRKRLNAREAGRPYDECSE